MVRSIFVIIALFAGCVIQAQKDTTHALILKTVIIKGQIFDGKSKEGLLHAKILIKGTKITAISDSNGYFAMDVTAVTDTARKYTLQSSYVGYATKELVIDENLHTDVYLEFPMTRNSGAPHPGSDVKKKKNKKK